MYCRECGEKMTLRFLESEGLVPFCPKCDAYKFPFFSVAVSMTVVNPDKSKVLLAKHTNESDYTLFAGYIKKGETAEKTIPREMKEETKLSAIKWKYVGSRYHEAKEVLMFNFVVTVSDKEEIELKTDEVEDAKWCTPEEARKLIRKNSTAEYFLNLTLNEIARKK